MLGNSLMSYPVKSYFLVTKNAVFMRLAAFQKHLGLYIYERNLNEKKVTVALNARDCEVEIGRFLPTGTMMMSESYSGSCLGAFGYAIWVG